MPRCKYCKQMLSSLDKDICPFCGGLKPLDGQINETDDITKTIDPITSECDEYHTKSRKITVLLWLFLGFSGAPLFYLKKPKAGLTAILITLLMVGGCGSILFFLVPGLNNAFGFLIPFFILLVVGIIMGFVYMFNHYLK